MPACCTPPTLCRRCAAELAQWHESVESQSPAQPARDWRTDQIAALADTITQAERWNAYAERHNAKAVANGLIDAETVAQATRDTEARLTELRARLAALVAETAA